MNFWDYLLLAALVLAAAFAARRIFKNRGKACGGDCANCEKASYACPEYRRRSGDGEK